jgi:hypothetical protein
MIVAIIVIAIYIILSSWTLLLIQREHDQEVTWLRAHIEELEADKRALTESICRSEGRVFIPPRKQGIVEPAGEGWFDGKTEITVHE